MANCRAPMKPCRIPGGKHMCHSSYCNRYRVAGREVRGARPRAERPRREHLWKNNSEYFVNLYQACAE